MRMLHSMICYQLLVSKTVVLIFVLVVFFVLGFKQTCKFYSLIQANKSDVFSLTGTRIIINLWRCGVAVTKAQLYSSKPQHCFYTGSNFAGIVSEICYAEILEMISTVNKAKHFLLVNHSAKTIHHHHHHSHGDYKYI